MATNNKKKTNTSSNKKNGSTSPKNNPNYKYQKKAYRELKNTAKRYPKGFLIALLIVAVVIGIGLAVYFLFIKKNNNSGTSSSEAISSEVISGKPIIATEGISINFLELGNYHTGDSTFIKAGDADILIDAGSVQSSAATIKEFVDQYCTDGKLEYVIATHAHTDHIAGFVGTTKIPGLFDCYKVGTLIDFSRTNQSETTTSGGVSLYGKYKNKVEEKIASGEIENHFDALQCIQETENAKKTYTITNSVTMTILDQKYYRPESETGTMDGENNFSVCTLFTHGSNNYLFTGDLEKEGEESLVELNTLPHCQLFKGGHHGSGTSNTDTLLNVITPEVVCICCCAGNDEYAKDPLNYFPYQETIDRLAKHTDQIFVTTLSTDGHTGFTSMNGNIAFKCDDGINYTVTGSNNSIILKETDWFKENRTWPTDGV